jgi:hypothetical protein
MTRSFKVIGLPDPDFPDPRILISDNQGFTRLTAAAILSIQLLASRCHYLN